MEKQVKPTCTPPRYATFTGADARAAPDSGASSCRGASRRHGAVDLEPELADDGRPARRALEQRAEIFFQRFTMVPQHLSSSAGFYIIFVRRRRAGGERRERNDDRAGTDGLATGRAARDPGSRRPPARRERRVGGVGLDGVLNAIAATAR